MVTFTAHALPDAAQHERGTVGTLEGHTEGADDKLVGLGLGLDRGDRSDRGHWLGTAGLVNLARWKGKGRGKKTKTKTNGQVHSKSKQGRFAMSQKKVTI